MCAVIVIYTGRDAHGLCSSSRSDESIFVIKLAMFTSRQAAPTRELIITQNSCAALLFYQVTFQDLASRVRGLVDHRVHRASQTYTLYPALQVHRLWYRKLYQCQIKLEKSWTNTQPSRPVTDQCQHQARAVSSTNKCCRNRLFPWSRRLLHCPIFRCICLLWCSRSFRPLALFVPRRTCHPPLNQAPCSVGTALAIFIVTVRVTKLKQTEHYNSPNVSNEL